MPRHGGCLRDETYPFPRRREIAGGTIRLAPHGSLPPMHSIFLADLAATLSHDAAMLRHDGQLFPCDSLASHWAASRTRIDLWQRVFGRYRQCRREGDWIAMRAWWDRYTAILEEILIGDILTRVVAALGAQVDRVRGSVEVTPVTEAIQRSHLEVCTRVQRVMVDGRGCSVPEAVRLNRLRQGVERWTDALIGRMLDADRTGIGYAIERERAEAYADETRWEGIGSPRDTAHWLMRAAMIDMLGRRASPVASLPEANRKVGTTVLKMLGRGPFDGHGVIKSSRLNRLERLDAGADGMPEEPLFSTPPACRLPEPLSDIDRVRRG